MGIRGYRTEVGEVLGDNHDWTDMDTPRESYMSAFIGASKRIGCIFFLEPTIKLMFAVVAHY